LRYLIDTMAPLNCQIKIDNKKALRDTFLKSVLSAYYKGWQEVFPPSLVKTFVLEVFSFYTLFTPIPGESFFTF